MKSMLARLLGLALCCTAPAAWSFPRIQAWASMVVTGSITVAPDGHVSSFTLDHPEQLPQSVNGFLGSAIPHWRFEPVARDGKPVLATARMSVRVVAKPMGENRYSLSVAGTLFGGGHSTEQISYKDAPPPKYPMEARMEALSADVYLLMYVNRQGQVEHVSAQKVDLTVRGNRFEMDRWRKMFSKAAEKATRHWTFNVPTSGNDVQDPYWLARVSIHYQMHREEHPRRTYGHWMAYIPGPTQSIPWLPDDREIADGDIDAMAEGLQSAEQSLHRIAPHS